MVLAGVLAMYLPFQPHVSFRGQVLLLPPDPLDDEPMRSGSRMEQDIARYLAYRAGWKAGHVLPGSSWSQQVAREEQGDKDGQ